VKGVIVDTSIWIHHFRSRNEVLVALMENDLALTHPMVVAELACGSLDGSRIQTLSKIENLNSSTNVSLPKVRQFIEFEKLHELGCGIVDLMLLASAVSTPATELWTFDKSLASLCSRFGVAHKLSLH
jgi:predicted nucleic acid-binding protein